MGCLDIAETVANFIIKNQLRGVNAFGSFHATSVCMTVLVRLPRAILAIRMLCDKSDVNNSLIIILS